MTTKEQILKCFKDINHAYNDCTRYDTLKCMLDELQEPCEDAISRKEAISIASIATLSVNQVVAALEKLPPVNPQKPICPSAGVDCEDCPAYEDAISRKAVLNTLENMDKALDEDRTVENYKDLLRECYKVLPSVKPRSEWEQDHEILKAYSDGASAVLDKVRAEIIELRSRQNVGVMECLDIIDKYKAESEKKYED